MATKITSGSIFSAGAVIVGVDADAPSATPSDPAPESAPSPASSDQYYIVGAIGDDTSGSNSGGAFVYDANDLSAAPVQLSWPGASTNDKFGSATVSSSDKFVVGAYGDNGFKGSLFVYDKNDLSADPVQLTAPDGVDWDLLGDYDLAMSDTHILAGAFGDDDVATSAGSAYLWDLSDLSASPTKLQPSNLIPYSRFGTNVALSDSYAIISAQGGNADTGNTDAGSGSHQDPGGIYIYDLSDLSAAPIELMAPEDGDVVGSSFGAGQGGSIGILGNTLVVGASTLLIDGDSRAGKVYIYDMSDLSAAPIELTEPSSGYWFLFGSAVDVTETHIVVGAPRSRSGSPSSKDSGAVYIYDRSDLSAAPVQLLGNDLVSTNRPNFGRSVDLTDTTVIVGAPNEAIDGNNSVGAVYIWSLSDLTANPTRLTSPNAAAGDEFGVSVAITSGSIFSAGAVPATPSAPDPASISLTYYAVASDASDDNAMNEGSVFIYNVNDGSFVTQLDVSSVDPSRVQDRLGYELESYGSKLFIRAHGDDESAYNVGAVFVYDANDLTSDPIKLFPSSPISGRSNFGESIVSTDDKLFIGESGQMFATESGRVHVYDLSDLSADPTVLSAGVSGDGFGKSLTVSSGKLFVGAHTDNVGKVYVYDLSDLVASPAIISGQGNQFGFELTSNSNTIFVHGRDNSQAGAIRAYDATDLSFLNAWFGADGSDYLGWDMSADENYLYTGSPQMNKVNVYDLSNYSASPIELTASGSSGFGYSINVKETALIVGSNEAAYVYDTTDLNASPLVLTNDDGATGENFGIYTALLSQ